ncbi:MAG: hypothetical protein LBF39_02695 [Prevotellaceae bacterium]|jgi:uncharacterized protein (TIGR02145 family)|nr:hypothetical protein [Prevotellaceae bacterium]
MTKFFKIMASVLTIAAFSSCSKDETVTTPPYAASTQTWVVGDQTWSDAIHDPACNKSSFDSGTAENPKADGRSYTHEGDTYYYYSWPYVKEQAACLCPPPWRVPSLTDFINLRLALGGSGNDEEDQTDWIANGYVKKWGGTYAGLATSDEGIIQMGHMANYWSSTEWPPDAAYILTYLPHYQGIYNVGMQKNGCIQLRCVK